MAAAGSGGGAQQTGNPLMNFLPLFAIIIIMYLLMILPQQKRQKEHQKMLNNLQKGDKVLTSGGIMGSIAGIKEKEKTVLLKIAENTKIEILRSSIAQVLKN
ncbi:preprotein translocase subunit YajC [bacterium]